jgi:hypothetical protein
LLHGGKGHPAWRENYIGREPHQLGGLGTEAIERDRKAIIQPQIAAFDPAQLCSSS